MAVELAPSLFCGGPGQEGQRYMKRRYPADLVRVCISGVGRLEDSFDHLGRTLARDLESQELIVEATQSDTKSEALLKDYFLRSERSQTSDSRMHAHEEGTP